MDAQKTLASRVFDFEDQQRFAAISGDHNPLHLDPVVARRTQAGAPVVHGVHLLLWALDVLAASLDRPPLLRKLRAQFSAFVYLAETVTLRRIDDSDKVARLELYVYDTLVARVVAEFGASNGKSSLEGVLPRIAQPREPLEPDFEAMASCSGQLQFVAPPETVASHFPYAARWLGASRIAALCASTNVVGMIVPGRHSIFAGLSVAPSEPASGDVLKFRVSATDARFRLVRTAIEGGGFAGSIVSGGSNRPHSRASRRSARSSRVMSSRAARR
jgi:acyl dehydratase